jgi:hypothetical protein
MVPRGSPASGRLRQVLATVLSVAVLLSATVGDVIGGVAPETNRLASNRTKVHPSPLVAHL